MKKFVINVSDSTFEKLRFEAIEEKKSIQEILFERIFVKPFSEDVQKAFDEFMQKEIDALIGGEK